MELCKRSVVVVGHSVTVRRVLQLSLNLEGYGVHLADNCAAARRLIDEHWPEAVIVDVGAGAPDLMRLVRDIRSSRFHRHMVVVASAPVVLADQERAAYEAGCDAFVARPEETRELAEVLEAYLPDGGPLCLTARSESQTLRWN
jgi:two-component system cell cycle response regulator DivK